MDNPLIELKELTKPLTKLIEVTAKGIGTVYAPFGTVRQAKSNAKAKIINALADKEVRSIEQRCKSRVKHVELLRQENLEKIVIQAALEMPNTVSDEPVADDWIRHFFNYAQDVCDDDIQKLWSRILAGEVSSPGSYSKRTLVFLNSLEKSEAEAFTFLTSYIFRLNKGQGCLLHDKITFRYLAGMLGAVEQK